MLIIMNSASGKIIGKMAMAFDPTLLDELRARINHEYDFSFSLIWETPY